MKKLIKKITHYKNKALRYRALYIKWLVKEQEAARSLQSVYYDDDQTRAIVLEILHEYGLSHETQEGDEDADEDKRD